MSTLTPDEIKDKVREWFSAEGSKVESITNPRAEFVFKVKFMRFFFTVVRPNERDFIQIESQVMISPQHLKVLTGEKMKQFQMEAMKFAFSQGINLGFIQPRPGQQGQKPPGPGFVVSDRIYDDAVSNDRIWQTMRRLHSAVDMVIALLNDATGQTPGKAPEPPDQGPSYYT
ncbi:MAG: hypothetical protein BAJATHORv1_30361 [Candidatus Thorarchaeota archaeon]|nr:MAG: hypothetical protein BAJATHORv1_30361 [Candidatus Thorarchaeota archaeon]